MTGAINVVAETVPPSPVAGEAGAIETNATPTAEIEVDLEGLVAEWKGLAEKWHNEYWAQRSTREDAERAVRLLKVELREVQDAAQTYHEAWQNACVYWKDKLAEARDVARELMEIGVWPRVQAVFRKKHRWLDED